MNHQPGFFDFAAEVGLTTQPPRNGRMVQFFMQEE